jgi:hypothetical protein
MHIRIKTAEEFRSSHVTIEVTADGPADVRSLVTRLSGVPVTTGYDPERADEAMAENYVRASDEIKRLTDTSEYYVRTIDNLKADLARERAAHVCTSQCEPNRHVAIKGRRLVTELEAQVQQLRAAKTDAVNSRDLTIGELETTRKKLETTRKKLAESRDLVAFKNTVIEGREIDFGREHALLQEATHRLGEIEKILSRTEVVGSVEFGTGPRAQAFRDIRDLLSSSPSSQA